MENIRRFYGSTLLLLLVLSGCAQRFYSADNKVYKSPEQALKALEQAWDRSLNNIIKAPPVTQPLYGNVFVVQLLSNTIVSRETLKPFQIDYAEKSESLWTIKTSEGLNHLGIAQNVTPIIIPANEKLSLPDLKPNDAILISKSIHSNQVPLNIFISGNDMQEKVYDYSHYDAGDNHIGIINFHLFNLINSDELKLLSELSEEDLINIYSTVNDIRNPVAVNNTNIVDNAIANYENRRDMALMHIVNMTTSYNKTDNFAKQLLLSQQTTPNASNDLSQKAGNSTESNGEPENDNLTLVSYGVPTNLNDKYSRNFYDVDNERVGVYSIHFKDTKTTDRAYGYKWKMKFTNIYKDCVVIGFANIIPPKRIGGTLTTVKNPEGVHKHIKLKKGESFDSGWLEEWQILNSDVPKYNIGKWQLRIVNVREISCE